MLQMNSIKIKTSIQLGIYLKAATHLTSKVPSYKVSAKVPSVIVVFYSSNCVVKSLESPLDRVQDPLCL